MRKRRAIKAQYDLIIWTAANNIEDNLKATMVAIKRLEAAAKSAQMYYRDVGDMPKSHAAAGIVGYVSASRNRVMKARAMANKILDLADSFR